MILVICVCCNKFIYAESSRLYILPTDYLSNNVSCPQNDHDCHTLNEWIQGDLMNEIFTNGINAVVLLPGVHIIDTAKPGLFMEDIESIIFTGVNGKTIVRCVNRFIFDFLHVERIEFSC